jgi:hypothetical protein
MMGTGIDHGGLRDTMAQVSFVPNHAVGDESNA